MIRGNEKDRILRGGEPLCTRCAHCYVNGHGDYFYRCDIGRTRCKGKLLTSLRYSCNHFEKKNKWTL